MEVTGKVKVVNPEQQVSASFKKRELVVTTDEQYPQHILIEFTQDKCDLLSSYKQGETRYFNSIQGWRIERLAPEGPAQTPPMPAAEAFAPATNLNEDEPDDLPF